MDKNKLNNFNSIHFKTYKLDQLNLDKDIMISENSTQSVLLKNQHHNICDITSIFKHGF